MIDTFFHPDGVAVIGAGESPVKGGFHILRNVLAGYRGKVYPVNPRYQELQGLRCYPDVASIPDSFDLAIYFIPAKFLPDTLRQCADRGVKAVIIESAGFSEVGPGGKALQEECVALARGLGIRLWGPNCMGLLDGHSRNVFSFMYTDKWQTLMKPGGVSLVVQSGMLSAGFLMMILEKGGMGISKVCSIGNKCDVNETELLEYLLEDESTTVVGCYLESITDGRRFLDLARSSDKPVVVLKSGRSPLGARAAMSHTASLSGEAAVYDGAFRQAGIVQVYDVHELMDFSRGFSVCGAVKPSGGAAIVTFSGGAGIVTTDLLSDRGVPLAELSPRTVSSLKEVFPPWMEPSHPVDLWPAVEMHGLEKVYLAAAEALMKDEAVDSVLIQGIAWDLSEPAYLNEIARMGREHGKPVVVWMIGSVETVEMYRQTAEAAGMPSFTEIVRCVDFLAGLRRHGKKVNGRGRY
ncbi:MAG TPA: hypothetical protein ENN21_07975 [Spirochaetes bacterium]|nr:hypothetical protein [Spirochaetota bacterium]